MKARCKYGVINESLILTTVYSLISGACVMLKYQQAPFSGRWRNGRRLKMDAGSNPALPTSEHWGRNVRGRKPVRRPLICNLIPSGRRRPVLPTHRVSRVVYRIPLLRVKWASGVVAQLGERLVCTQEVASSILADSTRGPGYRPLPCPGMRSAKTVLRTNASDSWRAGERPAISEKMRTQ